MAKRVLVPLDGSPQSEAALDHALAEHPDAEVVVLTVIDPIEAGYHAEAALPGYSEEWYESEKAAAEERFEDARERAAERGVPLLTELEVGRPARAIVEFARESDVDHIMMGSHGRSGVSRILLGSVAESVVRNSPAPVTIVR